MSLTATLNLQWITNLIGSAAVGGTPSFQINSNPLVGGTLQSGTGSGKADQLYTKQLILAAGASQTLDLSNLGNDNLGNALAPVNVKVLAMVMKGNVGCTILSAVAIHAAGGGAGYAVNDVLTVDGGTGTSATIKVTGVAAGVINAVQVLTAGSYTVNPVTLSGNAVTGGTGAGATMDLTMATVADGQQTYVETDYLTIGNDNTVNTWISFLGTNTSTAKLYSGNATLPGFMIVGNASAAGWAIGASNKLLKILNSGANPVTVNIYAIGATV